MISEEQITIPIYPLCDLCRRNVVPPNLIRAGACCVMCQSCIDIITKYQIKRKEHSKFIREAIKKRNKEAI